MTAKQHRKAAEDLIREHYRESTKTVGWTVTPLRFTEALIHATLAVAAAIEEGREPEPSHG